MYFSITVDVTIFEVVWTKSFYSPEESQFLWKSMVERCVSYWNSPFVGDIVNFFRDVKMFLENSIWNLVARKVEKVLACFWVYWLIFLKLPIFHVKKIYTKCVCCVSGFRICKNANPNWWFHLILFQHQAVLSVTGSWDHCSRWDCYNKRWTEMYTSIGIKCLVFFHTLYICYISF